MHVLIVEDDDALRQTLQLALRLSGHRVALASNGRQALQVFQDAQSKGQPIDMVVTDIQMPEMRGDELISRLQQDTNEPEILAISGFGDKPLLSKLMQRGCRYFLDKPFASDQFRDLVSQISQKRHVRRMQHSEAPAERSLSLPQPEDGVLDPTHWLSSSGGQVGEALPGVESEGGFEACDRFEGHWQKSAEGPALLSLLLHQDRGEFCDSLLLTFPNGRVQQKGLASLIKALMMQIEESMPLLNTANALMHERWPWQMSVSAAHLRLHAREQWAEYTSAGDHVAWLAPKGSKTLQPFYARGCSLGVFPRIALETLRFPWYSGDRFYLHTADLCGLSREDERSHKTIRLGETGLCRFLSQGLDAQGKESLQWIWAELSAFAKGKIPERALLFQLEATSHSLQTSEK